MNPHLWNRGQKDNLTWVEENTNRNEQETLHLHLH